MGQILVKTDPLIKQTDIQHPLVEPTEEDDTSYENNIKPSEVYGIFCPLISVNGMPIEINDLVRANLDCTQRLPKISFVFNDKHEIFNSFNSPGKENELRFQVLPTEDDVYKKIDLTFFIDTISIGPEKEKNKGKVISGTGTYKLPALTDTLFKALGIKSTYALFEFVAEQTQLGFASNVDATTDDRYIYAANKSYLSLLTEEIKRSESDQEHVYDWWVDPWNYIILCDILDRVKNLDQPEDMTVRVTTNRSRGGKNSTQGHTDMECILSNGPWASDTDLEVYSYTTNNEPWRGKSMSNMLEVSVYEENKKEYIGHIIEDSNITRDEFMRFEYGGEVYGAYNYILAEKCRDFYLAKMRNESITVSLKFPQLGIMRGDQLKFIWYDNDSKTAIRAHELYDVPTALKNANMEWLLDYTTEEQYNPTSPSHIAPNYQVSGQYTCIGYRILYDGTCQEWSHELILVRPDEYKPIFEIVDKSAKSDSDVQSQLMDVSFDVGGKIEEVKGKTWEQLTSFTGGLF